MEKPEYKVCVEGSCSVAVPLEVPPELKAEGMAREIVHRIQTMRRTANFDIADYITTYYQGDDYIRQVMTDAPLSVYIRQETLSKELRDSVPEDGAYSESFKLDGHQFTLSVKK